MTEHTPLHRYKERSQLKDTFESLDHDKRQRIIDSCIEEFALNGYERASTNSIVKKADISKGALFNYFGRKKNLFLYIFDYCMDYLLNKYYSIKHLQPSDLFERFIWFSMHKVRISLEEPMKSKLVVSAVTNMPDELKDDLTHRYTLLHNQFTPELLKDIDTSNFRDGVDHMKAVELVIIFLDGLSNRYMKEYKDQSAEEIFNKMDEILKESAIYLEILKYGIYNKDFR